MVNIYMVVENGFEFDYFITVLYRVDVVDDAANGQALYQAQKTSPTI